MKRRNFVKSSIITGAVFSIVPRKVLGKGFVPPSDEITLGFIGLGKQSRGLANRFIEQTNTRILACCDVFQSKLDWFKNTFEKKYAEQQQLNKYQGIDQYAKYEELIARDDIDAVVIITPDHWHAIPSIRAMEAGKDVYCEKPLAHTVEEGRQMVQAAEKYGRVLQTGSMQRSRDNFRKACELVRNGYIGQVTKVLVNVGDPAKPCDLTEEPMPKGLDWDRWCGPGPVRPYNHQLAPKEANPDFWPQWRQYQEFGGGILCDWGAHMFDIAQWGLGMDHTGPIRFIPPSNPGSVRGLKMIYQNGVEMIHQDFGRGWGVRFIGTDGTLDISRKYLDSKPENIITAELKEGEVHLYKSDNHYVDWVNAIKKRSKPICDVETGHRSASICNLANIAYRTLEALDWDPQKEKFLKNGKANKLRTKKYRRPYRI